MVPTVRSTPLNCLEMIGWSMAIGESRRNQQAVVSYQQIDRARCRERYVTVVAANQSPVRVCFLGVIDD